MNWKILGDLHWIDEAGQTQVLSAGSGLVRVGDFLWIAADDLHHLVSVPLNGFFCGMGHRIFEGDLPEEKKARKKVKPDTEALIHISWEGRELLVAFPSGSKTNRTRGAVLTLDNSGEVIANRVVDFSLLIQALDRKIPDLNIEGGAVLNDKLVLLQRGNGQAGFNAVIELDLARFCAGMQGSWDIERTVGAIREVPLPEMKGTRLTFTDCEDVNGTLYFSAAAEGGDDTYLDGEVMGSAIGYLGKDFVPKILDQIEHHKVEGLAFSKAEDGKIEFLLVTDADDPQTPSKLLSVIV